MISTLISAIVLFVSTNIDDIVILTLLFSQVKERESLEQMEGVTPYLFSNLKNKHIIIGQYLGIIIVTTISIIVARSLLFFPQKYVRILGLVPIYLGIKMIFTQTKEEEIKGDESRELNKVQASRKVSDFINIINITSITIANGGDNIGIYVPSFAKMTLNELVITNIVFLILVGVWCFVSYKLAENKVVEKVIDKYKNILVPIIFIGLGVCIMFS